MTHQLGEFALAQLGLVRSMAPANAAGADAHHRNLDAALPERHLAGRRHRANDGKTRIRILSRGPAGHRCGTPILEEHSARRADSGSYHGRSQKLAPVKLFHPATSDLFNSSGPPIVLAVWYYEPPSLSLECVELSSSIHLFPAKNQDDQN